MSEKILALSWKQPFGTAMLYGKIETRVWSTKYRGLVLICTSKQAYNEGAAGSICGREQFKRMCEVLANDNGTIDLDGYAIAVGRLVDCRLMTKEDEDKTFVLYREPWIETRVGKDGKERDFEKQLWCHVYQDVRPIKPFLWKGSQGWRELTEEEKAMIEYL